jgi:flagellar biogenesis protein FliO
MKKTHGGVWIFVAMSAFSGTASADRPETDALSEQAAAVNAGLALPEESVVDESGVEKSVSRETVETGSDKSAGPSGASTVPSTVILRKSAVGKEVAPIPWYRSGPVALGIVLVAILGTGWLARRFLRPVSGGSGSVIQVAHRAFISPKQSVTLVRLGERFAYLGVTPDQVSMLHFVDDPGEIAYLRRKLWMGGAESTSSAAFAKELEAESARFGLDGSGASDDDEGGLSRSRSVGSSDRLEQTRTELKGLLSRLQGHCRGDVGEDAADGSTVVEERRAAG